MHCVNDHIGDLHHQSLNLFQCEMAMISHHRMKDKGNGLVRVIEYILTHKFHRYHKLNLRSFLSLILYRMRILQLSIPHHHQPDHRHQLNREVAPEVNRDPDRVSEHLHIQPRKPARSHNQLYLLPQFSRSSLWQLRVQM